MTLRRLHVATAGFLWPGRIQRILTLAGWRPVALLPGPGDAVGVWGQRPSARRGEWLARVRGASVVRVEDAFLRSLHPGRAGEPTLGLIIDPDGVHYDARTPSLLERHLCTAPLDDPVQLARARAVMARWQALDFGKYAATDPSLSLPEPGYVLVVDQARGDASVTASGAGRATFCAMLDAARTDHPRARVVIRSHPETAAGHRRGYFRTADADDRTAWVTGPVSPWRLLAGAAAVYTVSSQFGFEAICAGHRPVVFGQPFYAGWGLTDDRAPVLRRTRRLAAEQLFAAAMLDIPVWYDPFHDRLCAVEDVLDTLEVRARAWREDRRGHVGVGMRLWKRRHMQRFFGQSGPALRFRDDPGRAMALARQRNAGLLVWASAESRLGAMPPDLATRRVEDGFLRSRGLGADLVPPLSLVTDDLGIYYDATRPSRLERLIDASRDLTRTELDRARHLRARLIAAGTTKYNLGGGTDLPETRGRPVLLVAGQVADDASIRLGCGGVRTNGALLAAARAAHPGAFVIFKPHPDVEAGLRPGGLTPAEEAAADHIARAADPIALIDAAAWVWTLTSLLGFEALIRGRPVTCLGAPFYAGWGLTQDRGPVPGRRHGGVSLDGLIHAALIAYPRYLDPVTGRACPVEVAVDRLAEGRFPRSGPGLRLLSKVQGLLASQAWLWRDTNGQG